MYQLLHKLTTSELWIRQLPTFSISFVIAELFYKFKSFSLECAAFLVTWYVLDLIFQKTFAIQRRSPGSE
jgi:hypothetical protein